MNDRIIQDIHLAASAMRNGGIVVYPTETVYGIGCDPLDAEACKRVREIKHRDGNKPFILIAASLEMIIEMVGTVNPAMYKIADAFWPGPLTIVIKPKSDIPPHLYGQGGGVAFRVTPHPVAAALSREFGGPIISTSANISGEKPVMMYDDAVCFFGNMVDVVIDNPVTSAGIPSTILDMTGEKPVIIRHGGISDEDIEGVL